MPYLNEHSHVLEVSPVPLVEGFKQLQPLAGGVHYNIHGTAVSEGGLVGVLSGVETSCGQLVGGGGLELELLA